MKIAFIVNEFPSISETFILNQITGLLDMGNEVEIFAQFSSRETKMHSCIKEYKLMERTHYVGIPRNEILRVLKALFLIIVNFHKGPVNILRSLNVIKYGKSALSLKPFYNFLAFLDKSFDVVHCHFGTNGITGVFLKEIGITGACVTSFHGFDVNSFPKEFGEDIYSSLFKGGDIFICNSNFSRRQVRKLGCDEKKIIVLPVGVNVDKFRFSARDIKFKGPIRILTVARLVEEKGHKYSIKAVAQVVKKYKDIEYIIAGDGPLRKDLENQVSELGIKQYVKFMGPVEQNEVIELYRQAHMFILPSVKTGDGREETQGLTLQEAQAAGVPVISTSIGGIPEGILDERSGLLVPEKDSDALAGAIEDLIERQEMLLEMGRCGREFVKEKYDIKRLNLKLVEVYQSLVGLKDGEGALSTNILP